MSTTVVLELFGGFMAASIALWFVVLNRRSLPLGAAAVGGELPGFPAFPWLRALAGWLAAAVLRPGILASCGLLLLRLSIGLMMIHHGQDKLADPQQFATTYVASLHLPFPLFFAYVAGFSELIGSWLVILGLLTPLGALALVGTMSVAAWQHILTSGFNIYVLELVVLYLGGSLALLTNGPGRFSFDAGLAAALAGSSGHADASDLNSQNDAAASAA